MIVIAFLIAFAADNGAPGVLSAEAEGALRALECAVAGATIEFAVEREPLVSGDELAERWGVGATALARERHRYALAGPRLSTRRAIDSVANTSAADVHEFAFDGVNVWFKRQASHVAVIQPLEAFRSRAQRGRLLHSPYHDAIGIRLAENAGDLGRDAESDVLEADARGIASCRSDCEPPWLLEVTISESGERRELDLDPRLGYSAVATRAYQGADLVRETIHDDFVAFAGAMLPRRITVIGYGAPRSDSASRRDPILIERIRVTNMASTAPEERYEVDVAESDLRVMEGRVPSVGDRESGLFAYLQTPPAEEMLARFRVGARGDAPDAGAKRWAAAVVALALAGMGVPLLRAAARRRLATAILSRGRRP